MPILGGSKKHDWSVQEISEEESGTQKTYHTNDDVAGQLLKEQTYKGYCDVGPEYYKEKLKTPSKGIVGFIEKFRDMFKEHS